MASETSPLRTYVSTAVRKQIRVIAAQEDVTVAELLREALQHYLTSKGIDINVNAGLDGWGGKRGGEEE